MYIKIYLKFSFSFKKNNNLFKSTIRQNRNNFKMWNMMQLYNMLYITHLDIEYREFFFKKKKMDV
jgi:hypothetical protein